MFLRHLRCLCSRLQPKPQPAVGRLAVRFSERFCRNAPRPSVVATFRASACKVHHAGGRRARQGGAATAIRVVGCEAWPQLLFEKTPAHAIPTQRHAPLLRLLTAAPPESRQQGFYNVRMLRSPSSLRSCFTLCGAAASGGCFGATCWMSDDVSIRLQCICSLPI